MYAQPSLTEYRDKGQAYQVTMPMGKPKLWSYYWSYYETIYKDDLWRGRETEYYRLSDWVTYLLTLI